MLVYKYRGGDDTIFKRDLSALEGNYFWGANSEELNDPCEMISTSDKLITQTKSLKWILGRWSSEKLVEVVNAFDHLKTQYKKIGVYSMSQSYKDELLWAHYGYSHKGFCIEYDLEKLVEVYRSDRIYHFPVIYKTSPPDLGLKEVALHQEDLIRKLFGYKSKRWEYEQEYRIVIDDFGEQLYNFDAVKAIYFGLRMPEYQKEQLMSSLHGRGIKYFQIEQFPKTYKFYATPLRDNYISPISYLKQIPASRPDLPPIKFDIIEKDYNKFNGKAIIRIELSKLISLEDINVIAITIKQNLFKIAERVFIWYYIKGIKSPWVSSNFNPDLKIYHIGPTLEEYQKLQIIEADGEIIGKWRCWDSLQGASIILYLSSFQEKKIKINYKDGSFSDGLVEEKPFDERDAFSENQFREYFIIEKNGNLGLYSNNGKYDEAICI